MVGQEPVLFNRTIKENIKYGLETNDPSMITHAAREANAHEFITELSHGYDTRCGQRGGHLSGWIDFSFVKDFLFFKTQEGKNNVFLSLVQLFANQPYFS